MNYRGKYLQEKVFPLGGIGSGSRGIAGNGTLCDWEIFNRPNKGSINGYSFFSIRAEYPDGRAICKVIEGDQTKELMGRMNGGYGYGIYEGFMAGFPHFSKVVFDGRFPVAKLTFTDDGFPGKVVMKAFNPFIPLDDLNSSIPAAFFDISVFNAPKDVSYTVVLSVHNPFGKSENRIIKSGIKGVFASYADVDKKDKKYGDMTVSISNKNAFAQAYWYRGGWRDSITTFWNELEKGSFYDRNYDTPHRGDNCSVGANVKAGEKPNWRFVISWNVPNAYNYWNPLKDENGKDVTWKNYYATLFRSSLESAKYSIRHFSSLYSRTMRFVDSLYSSSLAPEIIDAVGSNLEVLKSSTVLRLEDGTLYGWEGTAQSGGNCEGTCTHVWSYAYALCFLFPELERTLRNTELNNDTDPDGKMHFRTTLPLGRDRWDFRACVDGQMATIFKIYRDWKITGNTDWVRENWDKIRLVLEYAWSKDNPDAWDLDRDGVLEGRQHHTLDMELFGPSAWLEGMYLAALKAASELAIAVGDNEKAAEYDQLFENGYRVTNEKLFNGQYYVQDVNLSDRTPLDRFGSPGYWNDEAGQIKYQIADGCEIDQLLGQWHANLCGLGDIFDPIQRKTALKNIMKNNYVASLRNYANMWRVFALNDEGGVLMCSYPNDRPAIPIPYCDEFMTGFEYAFAGLLMSEGFYDDGYKVVKSIRDRYDGFKRNPYNEIECGGNYARAMASFALLPILSGMSYNLNAGEIGFDPLKKGDGCYFFSLGTGWGRFVISGKKAEIIVDEGYLKLSSVEIGGIGKVASLTVDGKETGFKQSGNRLFFDQVEIRNRLTVVRR
ncbi:MAG: hypothetical protein J5850_03680 [Clostridia bacterium]|nr:hypothetical protein [Clostridia bacterium]